MGRWADQKISIAFVKMLKTQTADEITVIKVCEKAGVNRQSFYYHFKDMGELIRYIVKDKLERYIPKDNIYKKWPEQLERVLAYSKKHKERILNICKSSYKAEFLNILKEHAEYLLEEAVDQYLKETETKIIDEERVFLVKTCSLTFVGIYQLFVEKGLTEDPAQVSAWCAKVFKGSLKFIIEKSQE